MRLALRATRLGPVAILAVFLAACSGGGAAASATPPPDAAGTVTAKDLAFDATELHVPVGRPFKLFFRNLDGAPHNVAIYRDESASAALFVGDKVTDAATTYQVPALDPGTYFFRCDVHPAMKGTVVAGGGS